MPQPAYEPGEAWLREKYHDENLSLRQIADLDDVAPPTVMRAMDRYGIPRRSITVANVNRDVGAGFLHADKGGYEKIKHSVDDTTTNVHVHRLCAVAWFGYDTATGGVVHHRNGIPWDNREDNLEMLDSQSEHAVLHDDGDRNERGQFV